MKQRSRRGGKPRGRILRRILLVAAVTVGVAVVGAFGVVGYVAATLDTEADMEVMEAMRGSRTTRIWAPERTGAGDEIDAEHYIPVEYDILYGDENMVWADGSEIPALLKQAFISIEDQRFYTHAGVDWRRTGKATLNYIFHFAPQFGGSTITQQLIKNVHGENDVTPMRKLKEIIRALRLEGTYSKEEILTYYLNIVPLGHQCTGVKSAARYYFGKTLDELTPTECAALAAITNAPAYYEPEGHPENNRARRTLVLAAMYENGHLSSEAYEAARQEPLALHLTDPLYGKKTRGWYTETVAADVIADLVRVRGLSTAAATALVYRGGLEIYALVDPTIQEIMDAYFSDASHFETEAGTVQGGMVITDPATGDILGVVGGVGEKQGSLLFNRATAGYYQPGSVLKPTALYGPAIERDLITYSTVFEDLPQETDAGLWPHNSPSVYQGRITAAEALARSKNTVAVQLYHRLGRENIFRYLQDTIGLSGLVRSEGGKTDLAVSPLALGQLTRGVTVREITGAYGAFVAGGDLASPRTYAAVYDSRGRLLLTRDVERRRVLSRESAYILTEMLTGVVEYGTGRHITLSESVATAGKTGTSGADRDKWFVGYTPSYVAGIRIGYDAPSSLPAGTRLHLAAWDAILHEIYRVKDVTGEADTAFPMPEGIRRAPYCLDSGMVPTDTCRSELRGDRTAWGIYKATNIPTEPCHLHVTAHYDLLTETYGLGAGDPMTAVDFHVLYLPDRRVPQGVSPTDAPYEYAALVSEEEMEEGSP